MNEQHPEDQLDEIESVVNEQEDGSDRDETPQPESSLLKRRASEDATPNDATDELARLFAKPRVWGTVLISMIIVAVVWAYLDNVSTDVSSSEGWSVYHDEIVAEFTNLQLDSAGEVAGVIAKYQNEMATDGSLPWAEL
ncbi:MAG: hypothetical protein HOA14_10750, partial [Planctomycetaceae bacterium]|nr:hypothetical protein [Planctomycetaceae bacterium]